MTVLVLFCLVSFGGAEEGGDRSDPPPIEKQTIVYHSFD
jgi:hypothetical protein